MNFETKREKAEAVIRVMRKSAENVRANADLFATDPIYVRKSESIAAACTDLADYVAARIEQ